MPGFSTTVGGLGEARLYGLRDYLRGKVSLLNTTLQLAPLSLPNGSAVSGNIIIGDPARIAKEATFKLCVLGGGRDQGLDLEVKFRRVGVSYTVSAFENALHTRLRLYCSPFIFPVADATVGTDEAQAEYREVFLQRISDWLRAACFQVAGGTNIQLSSTEYGTAGGDLLQDNLIVSTTVGMFPKGYGDGVQCHGAEIQLQSVAQ